MHVPLSPYSGIAKKLEVVQIDWITDAHCL